LSKRVRPLEREDISQVAGLYELVSRTGSMTAAPGLAEYFIRTVFDYPWADPEMPSLVYEEADGEITGFIASHVRRFLLGEESIRFGYGGQLVAHPRVRHKAVGAVLMQRYLVGAQDATATDTASVPTHAMWGKLHGVEISLGCVSWTRLFRPWLFTGDRLLPSRASRYVHPLWSVLDSVTTRVPGLGYRPTRPELSAEELTSEGLIEAVERLASKVTLRPDYDLPYLDWLFTELSNVTTYGSLVRTLLRNADGNIAGWYVYYSLPGGTSHVLQVMAAERSVGDTLDHLFDDASSRGAAALRGRLEPRLLEPLGRRRCIFRYEGGSLVHSANVALLNAIAYGDSLLTRMDGEWWMGHHVEPFGAETGGTARMAART
jgi:hypothetical protein